MHVPAPAPHNPAPVVHAPKPVTHIAPPADNDGSVTGPQLKLLQGLREAEAIGKKEISRTWLGFIARVSPTSSGFEKNVGRLNVLGLLKYPRSGYVSLTDAGRERTSYVDAPVTPAELLERACQLVTAPQAALLRILAANYPAAVSREDLAQLASVSATSSGFEKNVGALAARELATYPEKGMVRAAAWLMFDQEAVA